MRRRARMFGDGRFFTGDGRARFVPTPFRLPREQVTAAYPFVLNTGRVRDHWHTMTRTAKSPRLSGHIAEPFCELHPDDAARLGVGPAQLVAVESAYGTAVVRAAVTDRQRPGSVYVPMHWTDRYASKGRVDAVVAPETDPVSGQPGLKYTPVAVRPYAACWYGFAVMRTAPLAPSAGYWALAKCDGGWRVELAGDTAPEDWGAFARRFFGMEATAAPDEGDLLAYRDAQSGQHRFAVFDGKRLSGALFVGPAPVAVSRIWMAGRLDGDIEAPAERLRLLAGRGGDNLPDPGAIVCSCFSVGVNQIAAAVLSGGCTTVEAVGAALGAGTNCGSCRAEIQRLIHETDTPARVAAHASA